MSDPEVGAKDIKTTSLISHVKGVPKTAKETMVSSILK